MLSRVTFSICASCFSNLACLVSFATIDDKVQTSSAAMWALSSSLLPSCLNSRVCCRKSRRRTRICTTCSSSRCAARTWASRARIWRSRSMRSSRKASQASVLTTTGFLPSPSRKDWSAVSMNPPPTKKFGTLLLFCCFSVEAMSAGLVSSPSVPAEVSGGGGGGGGLCAVDEAAALSSISGEVPAQSAAACSSNGGSLLVPLALLSG
mmetsp:Transcript_23946/g.55678  ORF Transcript_23946/g.55678 Transcript_23946/m.55678 type:complete len:208 (-) Transcript_23946:864-1487(-)